MSENNSIDFDRFGFRNKDLVWDEKIIENLFIGDSFTVGYCVPEENHFINIFEEIRFHEKYNTDTQLIIYYKLLFRLGKVKWQIKQMVK